MLLEQASSAAYAASAQRLPSACGVTVCMTCRSSIGVVGSVSPANGAQTDRI